MAEARLPEVSGVISRTEVARTVAAEHLADARAEPTVTNVFPEVRVTDIGDEVIQSRAVQNIEELAAKLRREALGDAEALDQ